MTKSQWLEDEEARLIVLCQESDSITGVHRANCEVCWDTDHGFCEFELIMAKVDGLLAKAIRLEQSRADEAQPMPVYQPRVKA
jgi:hypothetical protein